MEQPMAEMKGTLACLLVECWKREARDLDLERYPLQILYLAEEIVIPKSDGARGDTLQKDDVPVGQCLKDLLSSTQSQIGCTDTSGY